MNSTNEPITSFSSLCLPEPILRAVAEAGYTTPTPIQAQTIPALLTTQDMIAQAQTGTGKTAAFALPLLTKINASDRRTQVLVLAPTRELANQVADGFTKYSRHLPGINVLAVYGGSEYDSQLRGLRRGAQIVVGTPGRVMDHLRRETLKLDGLTTLVLDEADEMLRMGFIDDVEWILEHVPAQRQTALFSATMPRPIRTIAAKYLTAPKEVIIETRTLAAESIRQRYVVIPGAKKADALIRILEMEDHDGVMVFVKTKTATVEVAERLVAHGLAACALNGDLSQNLRERTVSRLKQGDLNIIVATDVAARGLDVERISHVFNFDVPNDAETYVHRIGRTGRAGRSGEAILFLTPADRRILVAIERATAQPILQMTVPSVKAINEKRVQRFHDRITHTIQNEDTSVFRKLIENYFAANAADPLTVSAAIAHILQGDVPVLLKDEYQGRDSAERSFIRERNRENDRVDRPGRGREADVRSNRPERRPARQSSNEPVYERNTPMQRFRVEVGLKHGVAPSNIVGAIANEANISSQYIGRIHVSDEYSIVELPADVPRTLWRSLKNVMVCNRPLSITKLTTGPAADSSDKAGFNPHRSKSGTDYPKRNHQAKAEKKSLPFLGARKKNKAA